MSKLKGSKTLVNLMKAFAGESQARNRYTYFASVARKEGYKQIEGYFSETADNEKEHAERFYKFMAEGIDVVPDSISIAADFPVAMQTTVENLKMAAAGENEEWSILYPAFAKTADEEGFSEIASVFRNICVAEQAHEKRYLKLIENIQNGVVFDRAEEIVWKCGNCGYHHTGKSAPDKCPACDHPKAYFELFVENY